MKIILYIFNDSNTKFKTKKHLYLLGHLGLEPRTIRLKAEYSTIELVTLTLKLYKIKLYLTILNYKLNYSSLTKR